MAFTPWRLHRRTSFRHARVRLPILLPPFIMPLPAYRIAEFARRNYPDAVEYPPDGGRWDARLIDRDGGDLLLRVDDLVAGTASVVDREALLIDRFDHPAIVRLVDLNRDGDHAWARYAPGGSSLLHVLRQADPAGGGLPPGMALSLLRPLASAVDHIHDHGRVLRQLDARSVVVGPHGPCIADFSACLEIGTPLEGDPFLQPTIGQVAPETLRGGPLTPAGDIHALAALCLQLLGGAPTASSIHEHLRDLVENAALRRANALVDRVPAAMIDALRAALDDDPMQRPASGRALVESLKNGACLDDTPVPVDPPAPAAIREWRDAGASPLPAFERRVASAEGSLQGLLRRAPLDDAAAVTSLRNQIACAHALHHPGFARLLDFGERDDALCAVFECPPDLRAPTQHAHGADAGELEAEIERLLSFGIALDHAWSRGVRCFDFSHACLGVVAGHYRLMDFARCRRYAPLGRISATQDELRRFDNESIEPMRRDVMALSVFAAQRLSALCPPALKERVNRFLAKPHPDFAGSLSGRDFGFQIDLALDRVR
jgi:hypothetical protein